MYHKPLVIFLFQVLHVFSDMAAENILPQDFSIKLLCFWIVTRKTFVVVGNKDTTVTGTL